MGPEPQFWVIRPSKSCLIIICLHDSKGDVEIGAWDVIFQFDADITLWEK